MEFHARSLNIAVSIFLEDVIKVSENNIKTAVEARNLEVVCIRLERFCHTRILNCPAFIIPQRKPTVIVNNLRTRTQVAANPFTILCAAIPNSMKLQGFLLSASNAFSKIFRLAELV